MKGAQTPYPVPGPGLKGVSRYLKKARHEDDSSPKQPELDTDVLKPVLCEAILLLDQLMRLAFENLR